MKRLVFSPLPPPRATSCARSRGQHGAKHPRGVGLNPHSFWTTKINRQRDRTQSRMNSNNARRDPSFGNGGCWARCWRLPLRRGSVHHVHCPAVGCSLPLCRLPQGYGRALQHICWLRRSHCGLHRVSSPCCVRLIGNRDAAVLSPLRLSDLICVGTMARGASPLCLAVRRARSLCATDARLHEGAAAVDSPR
jgi:hypothetical protein